MTSYDNRTLRPITTDFPPSGPLLALYPHTKRPEPTHPSPIYAEPPTPTSTVTLRRPNASPTPHDDDPSTPMSRNPRVHSSSRTYQWIEDQQNHLVAAVEGVNLNDTPMATVAQPYLAYPQTSATSFVTGQSEDRAADVASYVSLHKHGGQATQRAPRGRNASVTQPTARQEAPATATASPSPSRRPRISQAIFNAPSPLRGLHFPFASRRPSAPVSSATRAASPASSSTSTFRRQPERTASHSRGSSPSTVNVIQRSARTESPEVAAATPPKTTAWKLTRPPVAGHFTSSSLDDETSENGSPPPRPSTSSSVTHSGSSTVYTRTSSDAPRKVYFGSIRSHSSTTIFSSSPSLWSLPTDASHINDPPESTKVIARDSNDGVPTTWKPAAPTNFGSVSNLLTSPKARKKRKLIISGIPPDDERRFEAVRRWCESFGELNSITRAPNGDLHVDFRKVEVADTVCRLNARVYIAGVGSVCLSWFTGKRP